MEIHSILEVTMHNARFRLMAGLAGATLCLFAVSAYGQNTNATTDPNAATTGAGVNAQTQAPTTPDATTPTTTGTVTTGTETRTSATDVTTTTSRFPGGTLGILAVVVLVLLVLFALFRGRDRTVVATSSSAATPGARPTGQGTAADNRMNLDPRAASGTGTGTNSGGMNDPNARR
jgi:hypothetical protein